jgi:hypothetical protein
VVSLPSVYLLFFSIEAKHRSASMDIFISNIPTTLVPEWSFVIVIVLVQSLE